MFGLFSNIKIISIIGCVLVMIGTYLYISKLQNDNIKLSSKLNTAQYKVSLLQNEKEQLKKDLKNTQDYYNKVSLLEKELLSEYRNKILKIEDIDKSKKLESILKSRKSSLLLLKINNQAKCQWENFFEYDTDCINGNIK